jgi:ATP-binding cassette subfamily C exporter for protease/lipase
MAQIKQKNEFFACFLAHRSALIGVTLFSFAINLLLLAPAIYMLQIYDRVLTSRSEGTLLVLTTLVVGLYMVMGFLEKYRSSVLVRVGNSVDELLSRRIFNASFEKSLQQGGGNPAQAMTDLTQLRQFFTGNGLFAFLDFPWFPIYLGVIFLFHNWLGWFSAIGSALLVLITLVSDRSSRTPLEEANTVAVLSQQYMNTSFRNAPTIEAMGMLSSLSKRWDALQSRTLERQSRASDLAGTSMALAKFLKLSLQSGVLALGAYLVLRGEISAGMMIASSILMGRALAPIELLIGSWKNFLSAKISYRRLSHLLNEFPQREGGMPLPRPDGLLEADNVYVRPPLGSKAVLSGITFKLGPGEIIGIIGPSASGKSSLARAMVGIWPVQVGKMTLDGSEVSSWNKDELGPYIGYLPQEVELFDGSVAENISRFGELDASRVIEATRASGVHEMILGFPQGYDTVIGDQGRYVLSGGQRQRIALARAMYGNPAIVVLDEPNSNLDEDGEATLIQALLKIKAAGNTAIVITHRTGVLKAVDRIMLLRDGRVQLFGYREEILQRLLQNKVGTSGSK